MASSSQYSSRTGTSRTTSRYTGRTPRSEGGRSGAKYTASEYSESKYTESEGGSLRKGRDRSDVASESQYSRASGRSGYSQQSRRSAGSKSEYTEGDRSEYTEGDRSEYTEGDRSEYTEGGRSEYTEGSKSNGGRGDRSDAASESAYSRASGKSGYSQQSRRSEYTETEGGRSEYSKASRNTEERTDRGAMTAQYTPTDTYNSAARPGFTPADSQAGRTDRTSEYSESQQSRGIRRGMKSGTPSHHSSASSTSSHYSSVYSSRSANSSRYSQYGGPAKASGRSSPRSYASSNKSSRKHRSGHDHNGRRVPGDARERAGIDGDLDHALAKGGYGGGGSKRSTGSSSFRRPKNAAEARIMRDSDHYKAQADEDSVFNDPSRGINNTKKHVDACRRRSSAVMKGANLASSGGLQQCLHPDEFHPAHFQSGRNSARTDDSTGSSSRVSETQAAYGAGSSRGDSHFSLGQMGVPAGGADSGNARGGGAHSSRLKVVGQEEPNRMERMQREIQMHAARQEDREKQAQRQNVEGKMLYNYLKEKSRSQNF